MVTVVDVFFPEYYVYQTEKRLCNSRGANKVSHHILYCTHTAMKIVTVIVTVIAKQKQKMCTAQYTVKQ